MPNCVFVSDELCRAADPGLKALFCISAIVMIFVCVIGILGACHICHPIFLVMWLIGTGILIVVIVIQIILNAVLQCNATPGSANTIVCGNYSAVSWAGLGVTLGLAVVGFVFGLILMKMFHDDDNGGSGGKAKGTGDYDCELSFVSC
jgi:hypothetical protein